MAPIALVDNQGRRLRLGSELGRGGEAAVHLVEGHPELVAKIYHQPPGPEKAEKLSRMVELQSERLLALSAWPVGALHTPGNHAVAGFLMKNMKGFKDIHLLYNPKSRAREFTPKANWQFLIHTAANVARAFSAIHDHGHVIGDVNQSNVRVSPDTAIVGLIDCDSFQISSNGTLYPCEVGVPLYTPPELQEMEFREVVRTPNHDNFGLAVLIFHLLFLGRHPFAGKFLGRGEMPIEKAIAEQRFAFARDIQRTQMLPPPGCITLAQLPEEIGELFCKAFGADGKPDARPDGRQWISVLDALSRHLMICTSSKMHLFYNRLSSCPWCPIEASGVLLFADYILVDTSSGFSMEAVWSQILAIPSPGPGNPPSFVSFLSTVEPSPRARAAARWRKIKIAGCIVAFLTLLGFALASADGGGYIIFIIYGAIFLVKYLENGGPKKFSEEARAAEWRLSNLQFSWKREASDEEFMAKLENLRALADEYRRMPEQRKKKIRELERGLYEIQLQRYLEQFDIASANILHIKDGRKVMLSSYGIDNAADVTRKALDAVPGFGGFLIAQLMMWRQSLEAQFKFNPGKGLDPADVQRVDQEIFKRRGEIEALLIKGPGELKELRRKIVAARGQLQGLLEQAMKEVAQAQADELAAA